MSRIQHDGDCTIYSSLHNGNPESGICTCGYGLERIRNGDWSQIYSEELQTKLEHQSVEAEAKWALVQRLEKAKKDGDQTQVKWLQSLVDALD